MFWSCSAPSLPTMPPKRALLVTDLHERIVGVSGAWAAMCGYEPEEVFGRSPKLLQGPLTDGAAARAFAYDLKSGREPTRVSLVNYKKNREAFVHTLSGWSHGDLLVAETMDQAGEAWTTTGGEGGGASLAKKQSANGAARNSRNTMQVQHEPS